MSHDFRGSLGSRSTFIVWIFLDTGSRAFRTVLQIRIISSLASFLLSGRLSGIVDLF